ncbi:MAG: hypothetical protein IPK60_23775 [Sandaracinaceae bacterium]|nr:hypothetical protein [Sandaracinaceae bacterium]
MVSSWKGILDPYTIVLGLVAMATSATLVAIGPSQTLDTRFFYSAQTAHDFLVDIGAEGRSAYLRVECIDFGLICVYSAFLLRVFLRRFEGRPLHWIALVPGAFDLAETFTIFTLLTHDDFDVPGYLGYLTCAKWVSAIVVLAVAIARPRAR